MAFIRGTTDNTNKRILQTMVSGIPPGLGPQNQNVRSSCLCKTIPYYTIPYTNIPYHTIPYHAILYYKDPDVYTVFAAPIQYSLACRSRRSDKMAAQRAVCYSFEVWALINTIYYISVYFIRYRLYMLQFRPLPVSSWFRWGFKHVPCSEILVHNPYIRTSD